MRTPSGNPASDKRTPLLFALALVGIGLLVAIYYAPIWWVSLTAPNYPPEAFPDGVRIHFHMNGVFNGCKKVEKTEITEEQALDCVHEMDTINHYVGMYPIAAGGVVEKAFSPFIGTMLAVMVVGFVVPWIRIRLAVMTLGFAGILVWMGLTYYGDGGLRFQNTGYLTALVTALDQDVGEAQEERRMSAGEALIARLKAEMAAVEGRQPAGTETVTKQSEKERLIQSLRSTFEKSQERRPAAERLDWTGSGAQTLKWHYETSLGRYFNDPARIAPMGGAMSAAGHVMFWGLVAAMLLLLWGARRSSGPLYWLMILVPIALPLFFVIDYAAWLWWYGHTLNDMGAFTVKPFMPTVFGDGKVAQFATHSYPYIGFGLMLVLSALLAVVALVRRKQLINPDMALQRTVGLQNTSESIK
jgi:hypothetical protein